MGITISPSSNLKIPTATSRRTDILELHVSGVKNYSDQNKHLLEVPSAKEMEKHGVQLGGIKINMLLLKKIEELTQYVTESKKEIDVLKTENKNLNEEIERLQVK